LLKVAVLFFRRSILAWNFFCIVALVYWPQAGEMKHARL
jgi:hypothetical protein